MGFAIAAAAAKRGANVTLVSGPVSLPTPPFVQRIDVTTALEMEAAVQARAQNQQILSVVLPSRTTAQRPFPMPKSKARR